MNTFKYIVFAMLFVESKISKMLFNFFRDRP